MTGMKQYLLSIYQPDGDPPPPEILEPIMKDIEARSEEHTSELQSRLHLVCRLLLEQKSQTVILNPCHYLLIILIATILQSALSNLLPPTLRHRPLLP